MKDRARTSEEVDDKLERAIEALSHYEMRYHPQVPMPKASDSCLETVRQRMVTAQEKDEASSKILNRLKESLSLNVRLVHMAPRSTNAGPRR